MKTIDSSNNAGDTTERKKKSKLERFFCVGTFDGSVENVIKKRNLGRYSAGTLRVGSATFDVAKYAILLHGALYLTGSLFNNYIR